MNFQHIEESVFAASLIAHVKEQSHSLTGKREQPIPDNWTHSSENQDFTGEICLAHHGLFDTIFNRRVIIPNRWYNFTRQFYSPLADLLNRMFVECAHPNTHSWDDKEKRNNFFMSDDFWTNATQENNYRFLLTSLEQKGLLKRKASTHYRDDPNAVSVLVNDVWVDIPGTYRTLVLVVEGLSTGNHFLLDIPKNIKLYSDRLPVLFLKGKTVQRDKNSPNEQMYSLIEQLTRPTPKLQSIAYVFAEKKGDEYLPRHLGCMSAYMLEFAYGSPAGAILSDSTYFVPQPDLTENETKSLNCSRDNWALHQQRILQTHPEL